MAPYVRSDVSTCCKSVLLIMGLSNYWCLLLMGELWFCSFQLKFISHRNLIMSSFMDW